MEHILIALFFSFFFRKSLWPLSFRRIKIKHSHHVHIEGLVVMKRPTEVTKEGVPFLLVSVVAYTVTQGYLPFFLHDMAEFEMGESDGHDEYTIYQMERLADRFFKFELLDEVFSEFLSSNRRNVTLQHILTFPKGAYPGDRMYTTFFHAEIPYMATVFLYDKNGQEWVNVKLNNDGFWYGHILGSYVSRHNHTKWIRLDQKYHRYFETVIRAFQETHKVVIYYNQHLKRVDVKLFAIEPAVHKHVVLTFEPGYPDYEHEEEKYAESLKFGDK